MGQLGPKRGQNEVFSHFLGQNATLYGARKSLYLATNAGQSAEKICWP